MGDKSVIEATADELSYLAGFIDADGYVSIQRSAKDRVYFGCRLGLNGNRPGPARFAARILGGKVSHKKPSDGYGWHRYGTRAAPALRALLPLFQIKAPQARLALEAQELVEEGHRGQRLERLYRELLSLQVRQNAHNRSVMSEVQTPTEEVAV